MLAGAVLFAVAAAVAAVTLRQYLPQYAVLASLGACVMIVLVFIPRVAILLDELSLLTASAEYFQPEIIIKCAMLGILGSFGSDVCSDCGQSALAAKLTLATKVSIVAAALPLVKDILEAVGGLVSYE